MNKIKEIIATIASNCQAIERTKEYACRSKGWAYTAGSNSPKPEHYLCQEQQRRIATLEADNKALLQQLESLMLKQLS